MELPKKKGCLGIFNLQTWNKAAISAHLNSMLSGVESLWVEWTRKFNLGGRNFWTMHVPQICSWSWRSILGLRTSFTQFIKYELSQNSSIKFWNGPWMAEGLVLVNVFTLHQIEQAGISRDAQAIDYLFEGKLMLPYTSNQDIRAVWNLYQTQHYGIAARDEVLWNGKQHSISVAYDLLTNVTGRSTIVWHRVIWSTSSPARDNLMMWKVIMNALLTKNKMLSYGMNVDPLCVFCKLQVESVAHLFFDCNELQGLWGGLVRRIAYDHKHGLSELEWDLISKSTRWRKDRRTVFFFFLKKYLNLVWEERNLRRFEDRSRSMQQLWEVLKNAIISGMKESKYGFSPQLAEAWT